MAASCPTHGRLTGSQWDRCGWRPPRVAKQEQPVELLCTRCTTGAGQIAAFGGLVCLACYERDRPASICDVKFHQTLRAHPEWKRQPGEAPHDYRARMARTCREFLNRVTRKTA